MRNINISELRPTGSELFEDSEGFLQELDAGEENLVIGGIDTLLYPLPSLSNPLNPLLANEPNSINNQQPSINIQQQTVNNQAQSFIIQ